METIKNYLDNMFAGFAQTKDLLRLKEDIYNTMEDKYNELKASGKTENEAIGIVISEFGNIDELVKELGLSASAEVIIEDSPVRTISLDEANTILADKQKYGRLIALGVFLCIMAPAVLILTSVLVGFTGFHSGILPLCLLLLLIAIAVCLFVFSGMTLTKYDFLESPFVLALGAEQHLRTLRESFRPSFVLKITAGVILCVLSPVALITISSTNDHYQVNGGIGVFALLFFVAIAVYLIVSAGTRMDSYKQLLQEDDYSPKAKEDKKLIAAVAAVVWPLTVLSFLIWSFAGDAWHISWILFPIVGICFGAFSSVCSILSKK